MNESRATTHRAQTPGDVYVHAVYLMRQDRRDERLLTIVMNEAECHALHRLHGNDSESPLVHWSTFKLKGPQPDSSQPVETVYVVSSGGVDDVEGNSGFPPTVLGVYTTRQAAEAAQAAQQTHHVTLRAVNVGEELPAEFAIDLYESIEDVDDAHMERIRKSSGYGVPLKRVWSPFKIWQIRRELRKIGIEQTPPDI